MNRTVRVMFARTLGRLLPSPSTSLAVAGFVALSAAFFTAALMHGDGGTTPVAALWAVAAVPFLPVLAAMLTMRLISDERASGRLDLVLTAPVLERDVVLGKYLGALVLTLGAVALYLAVPLLVLPACAPALRGALSVWTFLPAALALLLQSVLWCAVGLLASACFRHAAAAAFASLILMLAIPHAAFRAATVWMPVLRARLASMPFESHIVDLATGLVPLATLAFYGVLACFALFAATKAVAAVRLRGRAGRLPRFSAALVSLLAFVFSCLVVAVVIRLEVSFEFPVGPGVARTSARTRQILAETHGDVRVTCFLPRKAPEFRAVARLLRGLEATARSVAGARLSVDYVDPRWEFGKASELVRKGAEEGTLLFRRGGRKVSVPVRELFLGATNDVVAVGAQAVSSGEAACASALLQLARPAHRDVVYWTTGHGEASFDSYDPEYGMSDVARDMMRDGYALRRLDLASSPAIPGDCAVLVVAGARDPFSRMETARLAGWMREGGRLLVLAAPGPNAGAGPLLADLGVKVLPYRVVSPNTLAGSDVVARDYGDHAVTRPLAGSTTVFAAPVPLVAGAGARAEATTYTELVRSDAASWGESEPEVRPWTRDATSEPAGPLALAVALERGGGVAKEIALRPARLVVLGDPTFVSNGACRLRANANRDVFLNAVAWLAGLDALTASRTPGNAVVTDMDRAGWVRFGLVSACGLPLALLCLGFVLFLRRRRAS